MTPHLPSLHVGASLYLCTQRRGQGSSPECLPLQPSHGLGNSGQPLAPDLQ